ncbi:hypothetical protein J21TS7_00760 [Paenibacillus cineris]|uniref:Uncharacterized protein n=1 Tax=Paenibacillus cineris TaxID=237530 RepID=A0ABQ4L567_9BACL|nr:hypothetical protein J21TS7_00760 [Paenibacillus cineris]
MSLGDVYMVFLSDIILYLERVRVNKIEDWRRKWSKAEDGTDEVLGEKLKGAKGSGKRGI